MAPTPTGRTRAGAPAHPSTPAAQAANTAAFGPEGALDVVEAGRGGNGPCVFLRGMLRCYVLEHATGPMFFSGPGRVMRVSPDGTRTVVASGLTRPTSILVGSDDSIYVSHRGTSTGTGEVIRLQP